MKKIIENIKEKFSRQRSKQLAESFELYENGGRIWILHMGYAIMEVTSQQTEDILKKLAILRDTSVEFEKFLKLNK